MLTLSSYAYRVLQSATRAVKERGTGGWVQGYQTDGHGRYCAVGRIKDADPFRTFHGTSPAASEIAFVLYKSRLPMLAKVNDARDNFRGLTGYEGAIALMDHLLDVAVPDWAPSVVQGSQFEGVGNA